MATRRGREVQAEVGVGGGDTDKARTGHGRGQDGLVATLAKDARVAVGGMVDGGG